MSEESSSHFPKAFYRVSVKALIRDGDKILFGYEEDKKYYTMPGGGLDWGESPQDALKREIEEEMGCPVLWVAGRPTYVLPHIVHNRRGMDWFYNLVVCFEAKIDVSKFDMSKDYQKLDWFSKDEIQSIPLFEGEEGIRAAFNPTDLTQ